MNSSEYEEKARGLLFDGRPDEALSLFGEGLKKFPEDPELLMGRGMTLLALKKFILAIPLFNELLDKHPERTDAYQGLAEAYLSLGKMENAIKAVRKACGPEEKDADFLHGLGHMLYSHRLFEEAEQCYRRAIEEDRAHGHAWIGLASSLHRRGLIDEAISELSEAVYDRLPGFWEAYSYLGCLLFDAGRDEEANTLLKKIPLDELRDPTAVKRLLSFLDIEKYPERGKVLEEIAERAGIALGIEKTPEKEPEDNYKEDFDGPAIPKLVDQFWQSDPTLVPDTETALKLEHIFTNTFQKTCNFSGEDKPEFKNSPDIDLCEHVIDLLAEFLEAYPWFKKGSWGSDRPWRASGAQSLMSYSLAIIRKTKADLGKSSIDSRKLKRLFTVLDKLGPTITEVTRMHAIWLLLWFEITNEGLREETDS